MKEYKIKLGDINGVKKYLNIVVPMDVDIDLSYGSRIVDGKSTIGVMCNIDFTQVLTLTLHSNNLDFCHKFEELMKEFIVESN